MLIRKMLSSQFLCTTCIIFLCVLEWMQEFYKSAGLPNGYFGAKRIFTKILKPVFGHLRQEGLLFVNDSYLLGETEPERVNNIKATVQLLLNLGFIVHEKKNFLNTNS